MNTLKLKLKIKEVEFEIEGGEEVVKQELLKFQEFLMKDVLPTFSVPISTEHQLLDNSADMLTTSDKTTNHDVYPAIHEVIIKDLPNNEKEWILLYAFYSSSFGSECFTKKDISGSYKKSERKTRSTTNNMAANIKSNVKDGYFKLKNDTDYFITEKGCVLAEEILRRNKT